MQQLKDAGGFDMSGVKIAIIRNHWIKIKMIFGDGQGKNDNSAKDDEAMTSG